MYDVFEKEWKQLYILIIVFIFIFKMYKQYESRPLGLHSIPIYSVYFLFRSEQTYPKIGLAFYICFKVI